MKKFTMMQSLASWLAAVLCLVCVPVLSAQPVSAADTEAVYKQKIVAVVFDNSGSMSGEKEEYARYAMQNLIGLMSREDELYIVPMNARNGASRQINLKTDRTSEYAKADAAGLFSASGGTPSSSVDTAVSLLKQKGMVTINQAATAADTSREYWLVIMTDGVFDWGNTENVIRKAAGYSNLHIEYLSIGSDANQVSQSALSGEMIFFSHHAQTSNQIVTQMQQICCEISGRYMLPDTCISKSGSVIGIDLGSCDFTAVSLCVIVQNSGTTLSSAAYGGKKLSITDRCVLRPNIGGLLSGETVLLTDTFFGGSLKLTCDRNIGNAAVTVLVEPALRVSLEAKYQGKSISASEIRHTCKPGDTVTLDYSMYDSKTGKKLDPTRIFNDIKTSVSYAGREYRVGEAIRLTEGKNYATLYVSCMNGTYVLTDSIYLNIHKDPNDFAIIRTGVESGYENNPRKTKVTYAVIVNGKQSKVENLVSNHYKYPILTVEDSKGQSVTGIGSVGTEPDGTVYAILDLSALRNPDTSYTMILTSVTDERYIPAAEGDRLSVETVVEVPRFSADDLKITGTVDATQKLTERTVSFTVSDSVGLVGIGDLTAAGYACEVAVRDSRGRETKPAAVTQEGGALKASVDLSSTADGWAEVILRLTGKGRTIEGKAVAALSYKSHRVEILPSIVTPSDAPLGMYALQYEVRIDGQTVSASRLGDLWLEMSITSPGGIVAEDSDGKTIHLDAANTPCVNTTAEFSLKSLTYEDAGAVIAAKTEPLRRPAVSPSRIAVTAGEPVGDKNTATISRVGFTVSLDGEVLSPARLAYLDLGWDAAAFAGQNSSSLPVGKSTDTMVNTFVAELNTAGRSETEFRVAFTLRDNAYGQEIGRAEKTVTRYGFRFETRMQNEDGTGSRVIVQFRLLDHDVRVDKNGLSAYSVDVVCTDANGTSVPVMQSVADDGTIIVVVDTEAAGYRALGTYRVTATAVNSKGQPADNAGEAVFTRVPTSVTVTPEPLPKTSMNPWQCMTNHDEWCFTLKLENEPYSFDGSWVEWSLTFNGTDISDLAIVDGEYLRISPAVLLASAYKDDMPPYGEYPLRLTVTSVVPNGEPTVTAVSEPVFSVVKAVYTLIPAASADTVLDRFAPWYRRHDNTADLMFTVSRDGDVLDADELRLMLDGGMITVGHPFLSNHVFWYFFGARVTVEEQNGIGVIRVTVTRRGRIDVLHSVRCLILNGEKQILVTCGDTVVTVAVSVAPDPVWKYAFRIFLTLLQIYLIMWGIGFAFRRRLPKNVFVIISAPRKRREPNISKSFVNSTWGERWLWSIFCLPWRIFDKQDPYYFEGIKLVYQNGGGKLVPDDDEAVLYEASLSVSDIPEIGPYLEALESGDDESGAEEDLSRRIAQLDLSGRVSPHSRLVPDEAMDTEFFSGSIVNCIAVYKQDRNNNKKLRFESVIIFITGK